LPAEPFPSTSCSPRASRTFGGSWGCGPSGCSVSKTLCFFQQANASLVRASFLLVADSLCCWYW
jgi:hypothetical protein